MLRTAFGFIIVSFFSDRVLANNQASISISNSLSACVIIDSQQMLKDSKIPVLGLNVALKSSLADCGCKSALSSFTVSAKRDGYSSFLMGGKINFLKSGKKYLPLSTDSILIGSAQLEIQFGCAQPD